MKLLSDFFAVLPGRIYPEWLHAGTECPPELEADAMAQGHLESAKAKAKRAAAAPGKPD